MKTLLWCLPLCLVGACFDTVYEGPPDGGLPGATSGNGQPGSAVSSCSSTSCGGGLVPIYFDQICGCTPNGPSPSSAIYASEDGGEDGGGAQDGGLPDAGTGAADAGDADGGGEAQSSPFVTTLAGSGTPGYANGGPSQAKLFSPNAVAVDGQGNVYLADQNNLIRKIDPQGNVTAFAGTGAHGHLDGPPGTAQFNDPTGLAIDAQGNLYVADSANARIRRIDPQGNVTTVAGSGVLGNDDGPATSAQFGAPTGVAIDAAGNLYIADNVTPDAGPPPSSGSGVSVDPQVASSGQIRKIDAAGNVTTVAGTGVAGDVDGPASSAQFSSLAAIAVDSQGNLYVAEPGGYIVGVGGSLDSGGDRVREISAGGEVTTIVGNGTPGFADGQGGLNGNAEFASPLGLALDAAGDLFVADAQNQRIRWITPSGEVTTLAGNGVQGAADGPTAPNELAEFSYPAGLAIDASGTLYVADEDNNRIRKITR